MVCATALLSLNMTNLSGNELKLLIRTTLKEAVAEALDEMKKYMDQLDATVVVLRVDLDSRNRQAIQLQD